jgi:hypothetical protein
MVVRFHPDLRMSQVTTGSPSRDPSDPGYEPMLLSISGNAAKHGGEPLVRTDAEGLWDLYLENLPPEMRAHHDCRSCRQFVERYGNVCWLDETGQHHPLFWAPANITHTAYEVAISALYDAVLRARVTGAFVASEPMLGLPSNRDRKRGCAWHHMATVNPRPWTSRLVTAAGREAALGEDYALLRRSLAEYTREHVRLAQTIMDADALTRTEKFKGMVDWVGNLMDALAPHLPRSRQTGVAWRALLTAPAGFAHFKNGMVGTLLDDIKSGKPFEQVKAAFNEKMHPLRYQRPVAPPSGGNIDAGNRIIAALGLESAMLRREATLEDVRPYVVWSPPAVPPANPGGVFDLLRTPARSPNSTIRGATMTWTRFFRDVLTGATRLQVYSAPGPYTQVTTEVNPGAGRLFHWDHPFSWYLNIGRMSPHNWSLPRLPAWVEVPAVIPMPSCFTGGHGHHGLGVLLIMEGCRDTGVPGACIFPEHTRGELRECRSAIEAYSKRTTMAKSPGQLAAGLTMRDSQGQRVTVRALKNGVWVEHVIDRLE